MYFTDPGIFFTFRYPYKFQFIKKEDNTIEFHLTADKLYIAKRGNREY